MGNNAHRLKVAVVIRNKYEDYIISYQKRVYPDLQG